MPHESKSSPREIQNYLGRISGPLLDRIDLHVEVPAVKFRDLSAARTRETSAPIRARVVQARQRQQARFRGRNRLTRNARMGDRKPRCGPRWDERRYKEKRVIMFHEYAWAERAKVTGMPERFAQEALGHNSKAVHRAYAKRALMRIPSLEDYERKPEGGAVAKAG